MTQFEAATAATFVALARARVKVGGDRGRARRPPRRDQHDPLAGHGPDLDRPRPHRVAGGDRGRDRGREAGGAARPDDAGAGRVSPRWRELAERTARERGARLVARPPIPGPEVRLRAAGRVPAPQLRPRRAAAEAFLGAARPRARSPRWPARSQCPGAWSGSPSDPPTYVDAAHNPDGAAALAESLPAVADGRRVVACLAILADKDAAAMVAALAPVLDRAVCTELPAAALEGARPPRRPLAPGGRAGRRSARRPGCRPRPSPTSPPRCAAPASSAAEAARRALCWSPAPTMQSRRPRVERLTSTRALTVRGFAHGSPAAPVPNCSR